MITDVERAIREYLPDVIHLSLATCRDGRPWISEVHFVYDEDLHLYFRSSLTRRHSQEIESNQNVAGSIVKQHHVGQKPRGVYFEGRAELLTDVDEHHIAYRLYCERFGTGKDILTESRSKNGHKFYKIPVRKFYVFDRIASIPSHKYELNWHD